MSLLSEDVALIAQAQQVTIGGLTIVAPPVSEHFSLLSGAFKQKVGYAAPRSAEYTYVLDIHTGEPLELPQGHLPTLILFTPVQTFLSGAEFTSYLVDSPTDPVTANKAFIETLYEDDINYSYYDYFAENVWDVPSGDQTAGYNWVVFRNSNYPTPVTAGVVKVAIAYQ